MITLLEKIPVELKKMAVQPALLAQVVKIYQANQRQGNHSAKTRGEVNRTNHKLYRQKGTGHARHGSRKAPIFVGGGVSFAPKPKDYSAGVSSKMKILSRLQALAVAGQQNRLSVVAGCADLSGKTKELADFFKTLEAKQKLLLVTDGVAKNVFRAARNLPFVTTTSLATLNAYEVLSARKVLIMEEALGKIEEDLKKVKSVKQQTVRGKQLAASPKMEENKSAVPKTKTMIAKTASPKIIKKKV